MRARAAQYSLPWRKEAFSLFEIFKDRPQVFFLDSSLRRPQSRFSYIGFDPFRMVRGRDLAGLQKEFDRYRLKQGALSFPAGAVGYLGYDGEICFGLYDSILTVDHQKQRLIISSFYQSKIKDIVKLIGVSLENRGQRPIFEKNRALSPIFKSNFTQSQYIKAVRQALDHIRRGDIYQINLSHRIQMSWPRGAQDIKPADIYRHLRALFPSEFGAYFHDGRQAVLSASPERFLKLHKGMAQVKPMKGTRPRGRTAASDRRFKEQLLKSPKEIAELLMVTDLERNDLGRVCDYASIKVKAMRSIETYSTVFQATSTIEGRLRGDCDPFDLLRAVFPSGSVTGCPKIEAMKIIRQLERCPRGLYTGALGYMSFSGDMDFNVMIRTLFVQEKKISFHVGGGIVADSNPKDEWRETWDKARPLMAALQKTFA